MAANVHEMRELEERAMRAWPAPEVVASDGWILRAAGGYTRRANSVHPFDAGMCGLEAKIRDAEGFYARRSLPAVFKMTAASLPETLDAALALRGYAEEARTGVLVTRLSSGSGPHVQLAGRWDDAAVWRDAFHRLSGVAAERRALHDRILSLISLPAAFASLSYDNQTAACALGVVDSGWLGVFDVIVDPAVRRRGLGEHLMRGVLAWGWEMGAKKAYLQVMLGNAPALALYERLGFRQAYEYWYRVKQVGEHAAAR